MKRNPCQVIEWPSLPAKRFDLTSISLHFTSFLFFSAQELSETMEEYVRLPTQQFGNLVKRYIQHRKATQLEGMTTHLAVRIEQTSMFRSNSKWNIRSWSKECDGKNEFLLRTSETIESDLLFTRFRLFSVRDKSANGSAVFVSIVRHSRKI